jgi:hypothetical protein
MIRAATATVGFALVLGASPASAGWFHDSPLICRMPNVVATMQGELRGRSHDVTLNPALIQQTPTPDVGVVQCSTYVAELIYNTGLLGDRPAVRYLPHVFRVQTVRNGFVVRLVQ